MSEHTPGPWHTGKANPHVVYGADMTSICQCRLNEDATLIAAVLDLFGALKETVPLLKDFRDEVAAMGKWLDTQPTSDAIERAEAAIAKAEGK